MEVTNVQVYPLRERVGKTVAMVKIGLGVNGQQHLQLTSMRIVDGSNGLFVSYPNDPGHKGEDYRSLFYPVTKELRDHIEAKVLEKYREVEAANAQG